MSEYGTSTRSSSPWTPSPNSFGYVVYGIACSVGLPRLSGDGRPYEAWNAYTDAHKSWLLESSFAVGKTSTKPSPA